ncbi:actin family protein [Streptomyces sp. NPDC049555]|uniref:actin family protein n=1 Tax=Streptomyces sp. NPDC049555 TaxID=3154930 RepID=UPI003412DF2E
MDIVVDSGSGLIKAGYSGEEAPQVVEPAIVGRPRQGAKRAGLKEVYAGEEAQSKQGALRLEYPVARGIVDNFETACVLWRHIFECLEVDPAECRVLMAEVPLNQSSDRRRTAEVFFDDLGVAGFRLVNSAVLALATSDRDTGVVVQCGEQVTRAVPIVDGRILTHAVQYLDIAGRDLTHRMTRLLAEQGHAFTTTAEREIVRDIKERLCYISLDYEMEMNSRAAASNRQKSYELPDGQIILVSYERFQAPEALFRPHLLGMDDAGMHEAVYKAISASDAALRKQLYANVVLDGGTTMLPGLADRLHKELAALAPANTRIKVIAKPERRYGAWVGGSILSSQDAFADTWTTRDMYREEGPTVVDET